MKAAFSNAVKSSRYIWHGVCVMSDFWDPLDCRLPGPSVHGISQARILEWGAISSSRGSFQPRDRTCVPESSALAGASPRGTSGKEPACQCRRACQFTPVFLPGESNRQRSLVGIVHRVTQSRTRLKGLAPFSHTKTSCLLQRKEGYCSND